VKDGIAPVISYPSTNGDEVSGTIAIRGTAMDPDWTNGKAFKQYSVFIQDGTTGIEVPAAHRGPTDPLNVGRRPLQNDSTLAYLYTNSLPNGTYTIKVVVEEEGGKTVSSTRVITVNNSEFTDQNNDAPYITLYDLPGKVDFKLDDSVKVPITFQNSVKQANVHLEVERRYEGLSDVEGGYEGRIVYYKYFPNIAGAPFTGQPKYDEGKDLGYFIWQDGDQWSIRWSTDGTNHHFTGNIVAVGGEIVADKSESMISWDENSSGGFDFTVTNGTQQLLITPKIDEDPENINPYASNVYLGIAKKTQAYLPIMIDVQKGELVDMASMGTSAANEGGDAHPRLQESVSGTDWNGKFDTGGYVDNGNYIIRVRAEGADGKGISVEEKRIEVTTPYEIANLEVTNKEFSPLGVLDRVSVFYNISKDSLVSAYVYSSEGGKSISRLLAILCENKEILGMMNKYNRDTIVWKGNYPDPESGTVVTSGDYSIKLKLTPKDGSGAIEETISGIRVMPSYHDLSYAKLEPIGQDAVLNGQSIKLAEGDAPYYFEAQGRGQYYPPKPFDYTLTASGQQRFDTYPYVPFAGLMHRGFRQVDVKAVIRIKYEGYTHLLRFVCDPLPRTYWVREDRSFEDEKSFVFSLNQERTEFNDDPRHFDCGDKFVGDIYGGGRGFSGAKMKVKVYTKDGSFLLDETKEWINAGADYVKTDKGVFSVKLDGDTDRWNYNSRSFLKLEEDIRYSRLTNRFIPWFGFVNKNHTQSMNFADTSIIYDVQRGLGFPGEKFFHDPKATLEEPFPPALADDLKAKYDASNPGTWDDVGAAMDKLASDDSLANYAGPTTGIDAIKGYDSYLSDGFYEFIPITVPDGGNYDPDPNVNNKATSYTASSNRVLYAQASPQTPFVFDWPTNSSQISAWEAKYGPSGDNARKLLPQYEGDPQNWNGYGNLDNICYYELDGAQISVRSGDKTSQAGSNTIHFNKAGNSRIYTSELTLGQILPVGDHVENAVYTASTNTQFVDVSLDGTGQNGYLAAEDNSLPLDWSSSLDITLDGGKLTSDMLEYNYDDEFRTLRKIKISSPYESNGDTTSASAIKYAFWKDAANLVDNPYLVINDWEVEVFDRNDQQNADLELGEINDASSRVDDTFDLKLKTNAEEKRYVEVLGSASGPYELSYFDGNSWKVFHTGREAASGRLAWWNVSRLNGKYTVCLKQGAYVDTVDVYIGSFVGAHHDAPTNVYSVYKRAQLTFPTGAFEGDELVTVTPVTMDEIFVRERPIIITHGPIVEIKPSPYKFKTPAEDGVDTRPTLKFYYSLEDLRGLGITPDMSKPTANLGLNIHQITSAGDLQVISDNHQDYYPEEQLYCFWGVLDHFSTYTLLTGNIKLSAPIVFADREVTNKSTVGIYGTAEVGSELEIFVLEENITEETDLSRPLARTEPDAEGNFRFEDVPLAKEGKNYIYVFSYPKGNKDVKTMGEIVVEKDTIPPVASARANLYGFSPNEDGKYDSLEYDISSTEDGIVGLMMTDPASNRMLNQEVETKAGKYLKLVWNKYGFNILKQNAESGAWDVYQTILTSTVISDGEYTYTIYAIDRAGNISNNEKGQTVVDTTPPDVLELAAAPDPFTPNDDGTNDTTTFSYKLSEPSYVTVNILTEPGDLFRKYSKSTDNFSYPAEAPPLRSGERGSGGEVGSWEWDGRGSRNELVGGTYNYNIEVEDW
ncbi:MAG: hypothetical protein KKH83_08015, partial [Candidatus Margulisbacteria bacterium]|nr:hypothetical protein [Candidatus Margulisiibacteriota bacterium]